MTERKKQSWRPLCLRGTRCEEVSGRLVLVSCGRRVKLARSRLRSEAVRFSNRLNSNVLQVWGGAYYLY